MCAICGCSATTAQRRHSDHHHHHHQGDELHSDHWHSDDGVIHFDAEAAVSLTGASPDRVIRVERDILSKNEAYAQINRTRLLAAGQFALNFVSSPGSGKTSLLVRAITDLMSYVLCLMSYSYVLCLFLLQHRRH